MVDFYKRYFDRDKHRDFEVVEQVLVGGQEGDVQDVRQFDNEERDIFFDTTTIPTIPEKATDMVLLMYSDALRLECKNVPIHVTMVVVIIMKVVSH